MVERADVRRFVTRYMTGVKLEEEEAAALLLEEQEEAQAPPAAVVHVEVPEHEMPPPAVVVEPKPPLLIGEADVRRVFNTGVFAKPWLALLRDGLPEPINGAGDRDFKEVWRWAVEHRPLCGGRLREWQNDNG